MDSITRKECARPWRGVENAAAEALKCDEMRGSEKLRAVYFLVGSR